MRNLGRRLARVEQALEGRAEQARRVPPVQFYDPQVKGDRDRVTREARAEYGPEAALFVFPHNPRLPHGQAE